MKENVIDLQEHRLNELAEEIHQAIHSQNNGWREIGARLSEARKLLPGDREFGQWCAAQGFELNRFTLFRYRECYEFAAVSHAKQRNLPTDWSAIYRIKNMPEEQQAEVLERLNKGEKFSRTKLNKEYPLKKKGPIAKWTQGDLNKKMRELDKRERKIDQEIEKKAMQMAQEAIQEKVCQLQEKMDENSRDRVLLDAKLRGVKAVMTREDYRTVLGCLHPDRPNRTPEQLDRAFKIVKKLERLL